MYRHIQQATFRYAQYFPGEPARKRGNRGQASVDSGSYADLHLAAPDPGAASPRDRGTRAQQPNNQVQSARSEHLDPRLSHNCSQFHGAWRSTSQRPSPVVIRTVEDVIANRSLPSTRRLRTPYGSCPMIYGRIGKTGVFYMYLLYVLTSSIGRLLYDRRLLCGNPKGRIDDHEGSFAGQ